MVSVEMSLILCVGYSWHCGCRGQSYVADATVDCGVVEVSLVVVVTGVVTGVVVVVVVVVIVVVVVVVVEGVAVVNVIVVVTVVDGNVIVFERPRLSPHPGHYL